MKPSELLNLPEEWYNGFKHSELKDCADKECIFACLSFLPWLEKEDAVEKLLKHLNLSSSSELFEWNDAPERTFEEVRNALIACDL